MAKKAMKIGLAFAAGAGAAAVLAKTASKESGRAKKLGSKQ